ncbi:MAG TPA: arsenite methyltransferase [Cyclobacteriaceae bacterium]|nr:arsenite methyltransferase [Cyclobacteriaceae bacterium]
MKDADQLKTIVREKYGEIARKSSGCGCGCGEKANPENSVMSDDYSRLQGYVPDADLQLGCGMPTEFARISPGNTVVDLGSGAGNDCFVARAIAGEHGRVIGIDFTKDMIVKARKNTLKLGYSNVEFLLGDIEAIPLPGNTADVVVSNCVLNLVPDKIKAFGEIFRILKPGGHFSISDIVLIGELPEALKDDAVMYAGCVSGALQKEKYLNLIREAGFRNITIQKERRVDLPDEILSKYISGDEMDKYHSEGKGIFSITVYAEK